MLDRLKFFSLFWVRIFASYFKLTFEQQGFNAERCSFFGRNFYFVTYPLIETGDQCFEKNIFPLNYNNTECIEHYNYNNILRKCFRDSEPYTE